MPRQNMQTPERHQVGIEPVTRVRQQCTAPLHHVLRKVILPYQNQNQNQESFIVIVLKSSPVRFAVQHLKEHYTYMHTYSSTHLYTHSVS